MDKFTRTLIYDVLLLTGIIAFVVTDHNGWAVFFSILLFVDKK